MRLDKYIILIKKNLDNDNAGKYKKEDVLISVLFDFTSFINLALSYENDSIDCYFSIY